MALAHRAEMVGTRDASDARAGYPLGILLLRGEIDRAEHDAGLIFAGLRGIVYGSALPRSHLAEFVETQCGPGSLYGETDDPDSKAAKASRRLREATAYILIEGRFPLDVLQNVAVLDTADAYGPECFIPRREYSALKRALDRLVRLWKIPRDDA